MILVGVESQRSLNLPAAAVVISVHHFECIAGGVIVTGLEIRYEGKSPRRKSPAGKSRRRGSFNGVGEHLDYLAVAIGEIKQLKRDRTAAVVAKNHLVLVGLHKNGVASEAVD